VEAQIPLSAHVMQKLQFLELDNFILFFEPHIHIAVFNDIGECFSM
jgi:hypothetical protein